MFMIKKLKTHRFFIQCLSMLVAALIVCSVFPVQNMNTTAETIEFWSGQAASSFAGGTGSAQDPFLIETADQLYRVVQEFSTKTASYGKYFRLEKDIYINDVTNGSSITTLADKKNWLAGLGTTLTVPTTSNRQFFYGNLDGNHHTIYGLYISSTKSSSLGLFPAISNGASFKNIAFENLYITGVDGSSGAIAGYSNWGGMSASSNPITITNCSVVDAVIGESKNVTNAGGFIGNMSDSTVNMTNCYLYDTTLDGKNNGGFTASGYTTSADPNIVNSYFVGYFPINVNFNNTSYTNVYTDTTTQSGIYSTGVTVLDIDNMKGENAKQYMQGFDFERSWATVADSYPTYYIYVKPDYIWDGTKAESFAGGKGTKDEPFLIENGGQLYKMVSEYTKTLANDGEISTPTHFKITKDIYLNDVKAGDMVNPTVAAWEGLGFNGWITHSSQNTGFCGEIDGGGHTIYGLFCKSGTYSALIPVAADSVNIYNLHMKNSFVRANGNGGAACFISGVNGTGTNRTTAKIKNCTIDNCYSFTDATGAWRAGGFIAGGYGEGKITVTNCSATNLKMTVTNPETVGRTSPFIGNTNNNAAGHEITNCFTDSSTHPVTNATTATNYNTIHNNKTFTNVYTSAAKPALDTYGDITYLTDEQMKGRNATTYMPELNFVRDWNVVEGSYPVPKNYTIPQNIWDGKPADSFAGGTGTADDPFIIENGGQLYKMVADYSNTPVNEPPKNKTYFKITQDINLDNKQWYTNGKTAYPSNENYREGFSGVIYGEGHTIYGLSNALAAASVGLIPIATQGTEIYDLHLESGYLPKAEWNVYVVGAFIGSAIGVSNSKPVIIKGCSVKDFKIQSRDASAAFVGYIYSQSVGIYNSYCSGSKISHTNTTDTKINSAAFIGVTNGNDYRNTITIANSYCTDVSPIPYLNDKFKAITTFSNVYTNFSADYSSFDGITKLTSEQMKGEEAKNNMTGLDFETFWITVENGYPDLVYYIKPDYVWNGTTATSFAGGSGTATDPYLIENGNQLYKMVSEYSNASGSSGSVNKGSYFKIIKDIYLNDVKAGDLKNANVSLWNSKYNSWYAVTSYSKGFCGELDGGGFTVYGLYSNGGYSGLIPVLMDGGSVHNLNIKNSYITGTESGGGIVGFVKAHWKMAPVSVSYCTIDNVVVESSKKFVGGIIGGFGDIKITLSNCSVTRSKLSSSHENPELVSGFIGNGWGNSGHIVENCFTDSSVHPVTATNNKEQFAAIADNVTYINVYTSAKKNFDEDGVTYLDSDSKLQGLSVSNVLKGFDFKNDWLAVDGDYPVIRKNAGAQTYDTNRPGEIWSGKLARYYASGQGTKEDPYIISTGGHLALLANDALSGKTTDKYYKITENIYLNKITGENWTDNATEWYTGSWAKAFKGHLDGGYHIVSGLYLNKTKENYTGTDYYGGLFACIGKGATIEKLGIVNSSLTFTDPTSTKYLGAFAGFVDQYDSSTEKASPKDYPVIRECFADTSVYIEGGSAGGFIGCTTRPIRVEDSFFTGTVKSTGRGLFGYSKMAYTVDEPLVKNFYTADSKYAILSNASYDTYTYENCYSSSAQDATGLTRLFIDRMCGNAAKEYMQGFDFGKVWTIRADNETPGLKGFKTNAYSNVMSPEDIVISFETNCDLVVESITGKAYSKLTLPVLERDGYIFEGWYSYSELDVPFEYDYFPTFNTILYAKWTLSGFVQDFEKYKDSVYDYHDGYEYYRPTTKGYSAKYVHGGGKSMHRLDDSKGELDFLLFYEEELEVGKTYKMTYYVSTDKDNASVDMSLVHLDWPDVYSANKSVASMGTVENLKNGKWQECTFTFVAQSKWIAIRTNGNDSVYFDDFTLYNTSEAADAVNTKTSSGNSLLYVIIAVASALILGGAGITFYLLKVRAKQK